MQKRGGGENKVSPADKVATYPVNRATLVKMIIDLRIKDKESNLINL